MGKFTSQTQSSENESSNKKFKKENETEVLFKKLAIEYICKLVKKKVVQKIFVIESD